jgi:hypothetical protein
MTWMAERPENGTENKVLYDKTCRGVAVMRPGRVRACVSRVGAVDWQGCCHVNRVQV